MSYVLTFWGTRGSVPTPGPHTARYGGNTPCVALTDGADRLLILDAGTGIRPLGNAVMARAGRLEADLLLSHTHWDHIQGFPFFRPLSVPGTRVRIYGAAQERVPLEEILRRQMDPMVFPLPLTALPASLNVTEIGEGIMEIDGFTVTAFCLRHPGTTLGYRLRPAGGGREVAYVTDNELGPGGSYGVPADWRARLVRFLGGTDTLIHDAMYSDALMPARAGWGHSSPREAIELAAEASCRRLLLFHHDPESDDEAMDALVREARAYARARGFGLEIEAASEGMRLAL